MYAIDGTAPILMGRPVLERLGIIVDYQNKKMRYNKNGNSATSGEQHQGAEGRGVRRDLDAS